MLVSLRPCTADSAGASLICYPNAGCHRFKRTQVDPLCLPDILISEYACTDKPPKPEVEPRPPQPGSHIGQAHCSVWLTPLCHGQAGLWLQFYKKIISCNMVYHVRCWKEMLRWRPICAVVETLLVWLMAQLQSASHPADSEPRPLNHTQITPAATLQDINTTKYDTMWNIYKSLCCRKEATRCLVSLSS